jgi:squalene-hopene/tetraprenyl-beta-curcumene cyclase
MLKACRRALNYLLNSQRENGSWVPLWFGNQHEPHEENPLYGTSRVLLALADPSEGSPDPSLAKAAKRGIQWLGQTQNQDGSWGGNQGIDGSVEETALGLEAWASAMQAGLWNHDPDLAGMTQRLLQGRAWLVDRVESNTWTQPSPIGFYFAKLWYFERLYPRIFTVAALRACLQIHVGSNQ